MAGKYEKLEVLGTGSFGKAWLTEDSNKVKHVLKEIKLASLSEKEIDQTLVEVTVLAKCCHKNVIKYTDAFVESRCLNIVMEYAEGGDLQKRILDQKGIHFDKEVLFSWFVQIVFALKYVHGKNILHRDLKPHNIFLTSRNIVKLGDFGIARILENSQEHALTTIGTPYYLSPEIVQKKPYNHKSDIWALGCVLYELCCLRVPFDAPSLAALVLKIVEGKYSPIPSHYGPLMEDLISVLMHPDMDKRPSAEQILEVPNLQPYIETKAKYHPERKRSVNTLSPILDGQPKKSVSDRSTVTLCEVKEDNEGSPSSPIINLATRRGSVAKVKVKITGRRASVPILSRLDQRRNSCSPVKILNGRKVSVESPKTPENTELPDRKALDETLPPCYRRDPSKINIRDKENVLLTTYKVKKPRFFRRYSLITPAVNALVKKQKLKEVMSCEIPKRPVHKTSGPPPILNLYQEFVTSKSDSAHSKMSVPDDDVFGSDQKLRGSLCSLTYKINTMTVKESPKQIKDSPSMKQLQVLYESIIANHGSTRQAVVTLTSFLQEQLGVKPFQQLYSFVLESAKSAAAFQAVKDKAGDKIVYLPSIIQLLLLERALD